MKILHITIVLSVFVILSSCIRNIDGNEGNSGVAPEIKLKQLGIIKPRTTHQIGSSNWSVGGETMDRDYTIYRNWKDYIEPLGIKRIRIQSGWAKTEKIKGIYNWSWLDEIIFDLHKKSVRPWICLCFGNSLYDGGGTCFPNSSLPVKGEAAVAWASFVKAMVERYHGYVNEWEIWNEPNLREYISLQDYLDLIRISATAIREVQSDAKIFVISSSEVDVEYTRNILTLLKKEGLLHLIDEITYHPYTFNPDDSYEKVNELREVVQSFDPRLKLFQGENGAPSERNEKRALANFDWTEISQAKWALRRMMGDLGHDIPSSYFSITDMKYPEEINRKGLLYVSTDKKVLRPKLAYHAIQHMTAIFDDNLVRIKEFEFNTPTDRRITAYAYKNKNNSMPLISYWFSDKIPNNELNTQNTDIETPMVSFKKPVIIDLLSGRIYKISKKNIKEGILTNIPVYDSPIVIAEKEIIKTYW